ncbi:MAG: BrxA/BrxB family bacilliredoxin [Ignavibacteriaceae bacterium]|nr:BrxA/BrxB family bacilliredoxin [Ignavibacteriaceae bacterium]
MFNINSSAPMYDQNAVQHMRDELLAVGFAELLSKEEVKSAINNNDDKTTLVMINSVCGCAAGSARPGISLALQNNMIPDKLFTGFAGQEKEAVEKIREYVGGFPPSSPSVALFKNGKLIHFMQRHEIEGKAPEEISEYWKEIFNKNCSNKGPSISPENFAEVIHAKSCGSKIPLFNG